ncbi:MAG: hypothetical protein RBS07_00585 [Lentimicrobium sp.]|jgi:hypothetical protein|nr:hypothetical protein [Lentimicrobium sp.]
MKYIKIVTLPFVLICAISLWVLFVGYGNQKNHPTLNKFIVKAFLEKNNKGNFSMKKFKFYEFKLDKAKLRGNYISKSGLFNPSEIDRFHEDMANWLYGETTYTEEVGEKTPLEWIAHGGYSADVPEVPASFRHFYDPTRPDGEKHLTDDVNSKLLNWIQTKFTNPKTDGVAWAVGSAGSFGALEHNYTWENGKVFMKGALEEKDPEKRNALMAKAWRSLGETLHMIADNGCPAHVRNDAHPSVPFRMMSYFGNPDTYEEMMDELQKNNDAALDEFQSGKTDPDLALKLEKSTSIKDVAHKLAVFTNENFFTLETISGTDWKGNVVKPITHPNYVYNSPKLSAATYSNNYYRRNIANREVLMCTDTWFFNKYPVSKTYPYLDEDCVKSQASALVPAIKEAGLNAIRLYIPDLNVKITSLSEDGSITGEIIHKTDPEYTKAIKYNGPVVIKTATLDQLGKFEAKNGRFSGKITPVENVYLHAEIEFGGVFVKSEQKKMNPSPPKQEPVVFRDYTLELTVYAFMVYTNGYKDDIQTFYKSDYKSIEGPHTAFVISKGKQFSGKITSWETQDGWVEGEYNDHLLSKLKAHIHLTWFNNSNNKSREQWIDLELRNIPVNYSGASEYGVTFHRSGWDCDNLRPDPEFEKSIVNIKHRIKFFPSGEEVTLDYIDYGRSEVQACKDWQNLFIPRSFIDVKISYNYNR